MLKDNKETDLVLGLPPQRWSPKIGPAKMLQGFVVILTHCEGAKLMTWVTTFTTDRVQSGQECWGNQSKDSGKHSQIQR